MRFTRKAPYGSLANWLVALMWYDYFLTFPSEVQSVWGRKFSGATLAYLGIRYSLCLERVVILLEVLWSTTNKV